MTIHFHDELETLEVSQEASQVAKELLTSLWRRDRRVDPDVIRRVGSILERSGAGVDELDFVQGVAYQLEHGKRSVELAEDLAQVMTILSEAEVRLRRIGPPAEEFAPAEGWKGRFDAITELLRTSEKPDERRDLRLRRDLIVETVRKQPGLYLTQLFRYMRTSGTVRVTYATIWSDIHALEDERILMTIGGPQGSPLYCFPHPDTITNRGAYYNRIYGTEGTIQRRLTDYFRSAQLLLDFFTVNSQTRSLIMVMKYGATGANIVGARIKTFGRLHNFESFTKERKIQLSREVAPLDVLDPFNVITVGAEGGRTLWYDEKAFQRFSLYSDSSTGTTRYSSAA